jgi:hypothetical protein
VTSKRNLPQSRCGNKHEDLDLREELRGSVGQADHGDMNGREPPSPQSNSLKVSTLPANQCRTLVKYFDDRGGYYRIGTVVESHTATHGQKKGQVTLTIETALHQRVRRNQNEVVFDAM